jgi:hypothetical protein
LIQQEIFFVVNQFTGSDDFKNKNQTLIATGKKIALCAPVCLVLQKK